MGSITLQAAGSRHLAVVNRWADILDIADWFYWRVFEDMLESYYRD